MELRMDVNKYFSWIYIDRIELQNEACRLTCLHILYVFRLILVFRSPLKRLCNANAITVRLA